VLGFLRCFQGWRSLCLQILESLKYVEYHTVDNNVINAAEAFQEPVDPVAFPDYHSIVSDVTLLPLKFTSRVCVFRLGDGTV
jgi:hypothetical protein